MRVLGIADGTHRPGEVLEAIMAEYEGTASAEQKILAATVAATMYKMGGIS